MDFDRLDALLKERGISRRKLAIELSINENTMGTAFKRRKGLSADDVLKIARYLGVSPYYLEGWNVKYGQPDGDGDRLAEFYKNGEFQGSMYFNTAVPSDGDAIDVFVSESDTQYTQSIGVPARINNAVKKLNHQGQLKALERVEELTEIPRYRNEQGE